MTHCVKQAELIDGDTEPILVTLELDGSPLAIVSGAAVVAQLRREEFVGSLRTVVVGGDPVICTASAPANWPNGVVSVSFSSSVVPGVWDLQITVTQSGRTGSFLLESAVRVWPA